MTHAEFVQFVHATFNAMDMITPVEGATAVVTAFDEYACCVPPNVAKSNGNARAEALAPPEPGWQPNLDYWESRIEWYRSASKAVDDLPDDTLDDGEPTQDYVMSGDLAKDAADDLDKAVAGWDKAVEALAAHAMQCPQCHDTALKVAAPPRAEARP